MCVQAKKAAMQRDWLVVRLEHFSMELAPLQFQPGIDYLARPPESGMQLSIINCFVRFSLTRLHKLTTVDPPL